MTDNLSASIWNPAYSVFDYNSTTDSYVTAYARIPSGTSAYQLVITKFTASTNTKQWSKQLYTSQSTWYALPLSVKLNNNGEVAVFYRGTTSSVYSLFVAKFASDGTNNWNKKLTATLANTGFQEYSAGFFSGQSANQGMSWIGSDLIFSNAFSGSGAPSAGTFHARLNGSTGAATWTRITYKSYTTSYLSAYKTITASSPDGTKSIHAWQGQVDGTHYAQNINVYNGSTGGQLAPSSLSYKGWTQTGTAQGVQITGMIADNNYVYCTGMNIYSGSSYDVFLMAVSLSANTVAWKRKLVSDNVPASGSFTIVPILRAIPSGGFLTYARSIASNLTWIVQKWSSDGLTIDWAYTIVTSVSVPGGMYVDASDNLIIYWTAKTTANPAAGILTLSSAGGASPYAEGTYTAPNSSGTVIVTKDNSASSADITNTFVAISTNSFTDTTSTLTIANPSAAELTMQTVTANVIIT